MTTSREINNLSFALATDTGIDRGLSHADRLMLAVYLMSNSKKWFEDFGPDFDHADQLIEAFLIVHFHNQLN